MSLWQWHPAKIMLLWTLDAALLIAIWKPCSIDLELSITTCFYPRNISIWLFVSLPLFIVTWKWATRREHAQTLQSVAALTDMASIRHAVQLSAINGTAMILTTKTGSILHGRVAREGPSSLEFYPIASDKLIPFTFNDIKSVSLVKEEIPLPPEVL